MKQLLFLLLIWAGVSSCSGRAPGLPAGALALPAVADTGQIKGYLEQQGPQVLNFPHLIQSLYEENDFKYVWATSGRQEQLRQALMTLDCVIQFGLTPEKYHREALTSDRTKFLSSETLGANSLAKAEADVLLTDAILTFMFHLRYGKINPRISPQNVDRADFTGFRVDSVFKSAIQTENFREQILSVQPQTRKYKLLQDYQRLLTTQYAGDCYEISGDTVRLIALNLERYRWEHTDDSNYVEINIPSFYLRYVNGQQEQRFKVIVGKPANATPTLQSRIGYFTTAPDWTVPASIFRKELLPKALADPGYLSRNGFTIYNLQGEAVPTGRASLQAMQQAPQNYVARQSSGCDNALGQVVFNFQNPYSVYLHDTPTRSLFNQSNRALSHGCIRVEHPDKLAALFLNADGATPATRARVARSMTSYTRNRYTLRKPVPIIIRYLTCEIENGILVRYPDLYNRDKLLAAQLFKSGKFQIPANSGK
ncbi:MAG TPA: L,D-transpeptidase family protein [Sphingobacteriaceae bacterium]